jgi:four helix bundle protein
VAEINSYRDLKIWRAAMDIAERCYALTSDFPKSEVYGMTSQIRRASVSVPANIAEGYGRESTGNFIALLRVAQGSVKELETHLLLCSRVGLVEAERAEPLLAQCDELGKMLRSYIRSIQRSAEDE